MLGDPLQMQTRHSRFKQEFLTDPKGLTLTDLTGRPMSEVTKLVATLPDDAVIIYTPISVDGAGINFSPIDAFAAVTRAANRPILVDAENRIGAGATGGLVLRPNLIGEEAAHLVLRVLGGESAASIPMAASNAVLPIFDWRQLKRWNIDETNLPAGSEIRFRQPNVWDQYSLQISAAFAALLLQTSLLVWLLVEHRGRALAEKEAGNRRREVIHLNRAAAATVLSSSIAHELGQPLGAILNNVEAAAMLMKGAPLDLDQVNEILADIRRDDQRAGEIIHGVRNLLKKRETTELQIVDLNDTVQEVVNIVASVAKNTHVTLITAQKTGPLFVNADPVHMQQVILNLVMNGIDALEGCNSTLRSVTIETALDSDGNAKVSVADSGKGISEENLNNIFEAFFTTKTHGTGLGLPISRMIIEGYGGHLNAANMPSGGAVFSFTLPSA